jgi:putative CocE/NonD family hydrolase
MDPCTHKGCGAPFAPLTDPPGVRDAAAVMFEFLDKHLRGADTPDRPPVEYYLQGRDDYVGATAWPPAGTRYERLPLGPGTLGAAAHGTQDYVTDPAAGFSMAFDKYGTVAASPYVPADQRLEGPQGLTFRTAALSAPRVLAGPIALHLVAASTATDTDWYAKLADVAPDGSESIVTEGALRASHRALDPARSTPERPYHTETDPQPIEPGRFYDYDVEIWPTAYELAAGHRLQLRLTSTDLPTHLPGTIVFDRAAPQDAHVDLLAPATNTVRFDGSYLLVPTEGSPPAAVAPSSAAGGSACASRRRFAIRVPRPRRGRLLRAWITVDGRPVAVRRRHGRLTAVVDLRRTPKRTARVRIVARTSRGTVVSTREYRTCVP